MIPEKRLMVKSFRLGKNIDSYENKTNIRLILKNVFQNQKFKNPYIMVSSIEPRKNHTFVLDAFERLWEQGSEVKLCVIGIIGWDSSAVIERLHNHKQLGKKLFVFHDINDTELLFIYKQAKATITASSMEGFGLPIVESLSKGCPVFASDIPVYREVGGDYCTFFSLDNPKYLAESINKYENNSTSDAKMDINTFKWPTWEESTRELISKIEQII
jgi:alpha-1,2-rhamnosyltransferase